MTVTNCGIGVQGASSNIDVVFKDITIKNNSASGRCIDTRGKIASLTLDGVTLSTDGAPSGYTQPLTIGGYQSDAATVSITNSTIQTNDAGTAYYAIITFNPVNMTISNSTLKGWACIYAKGENSSAGSAGSTFTIDHSNIVSSNAYSGVSNSFAAFVMEDNNVTINITNSDLKIANTGDQYQTIAGSSSGLTNDKVKLGEGNTITFVEPGQYALKYGDVEIDIEGGTYNFQLPDEILPEGYICVNNGDGTFTVKQGAWVAKIGDVRYETLEKAVAAAEEGATIDILKDFTLTTVTTSPSAKYNVNVDKSVTINGNNHVIMGSEGKRPIILMGDGKIITLKDLTLKSNNAEACLWIGDAVNVTLDNTTLDGTKGKSYNQPLTIGQFDSENRAIVNITNGSVIKTNDAGTAHYSIIAWHPSDITVTSSKLIGWANVYLKSGAAGSTVKIEGSEMKSQGLSGSSNNFAVIVTEGNGNTIEVKDTKIEGAAVEGTYQSLFMLGGQDNVLKFLGSTTYETNDMTWGKATYVPGSAEINKIYFDNTTKSTFAKYFAEEGGARISETTDETDLYPLNYVSEVYYYWIDNGVEAGGNYYLAQPFVNGWLDNSEFIRLKKDVALTSNLTWAKENASFTMTFGDYKVTKGEYSIALKQGVTVNTDQQTDIFTAVDADFKVVETAVEGGYTYTVVAKEYVAQIGEVKYETLQDALDAAEAEDIKNVVIDLLGDATLDITAWSGTKNPLSIGTVNTESITINGNGKKLTFNQKNGDWNNIATMNDDVTKLILNNMSITSSGYNNGPWNRHDINFNCAVELNSVTSDKALAFKNDATLKTVTVEETGDNYAIWIQPNGQNISIDGLTVNASNGRGIKIDDQYVDNPEQVTLSIDNATFNTKSKSAILVKSAANTVITAGEGIIIANVAADKNNLVWVDEDRAEEFYKVTVNNATIMPESKETDYVACLMNGEQRWGFYKGTSALSKAIDKVEDGYSIKLFQTTVEAVEVSKPLVITKNGYTADNVIAADGFVREETETEIIIRELDPVAKIGDVTYKTLQKALDAAHEMTGDVTVELIANIEGYSIVHQKAGLNLTIDGAEKTVNGQIIIDGDGALDGTDALTIKNIKFEMPSELCTGTDAFVVVPSTKTAGTPYYDPSHNNHAHNITISDCTFTGNYPTSNMVGFKSHSGIDGMKNLVMENVTATNLHSLAQLTATKGATFDNCTATQTGSFIGANGGDGSYTVSNCTFESHPDKTDGYAYREKSGSTAVATLTNNNFKAHDAIILGSAGTINVESGTYVGEISKTAGTIVISGGHFSAMVGNPEYDQFIAEGKAGVNGLYPEDENAPNGIGAAVATVTDTEGNVRSFASLKSAFDAAEDGATITLLVDVNENVAVSGEKSVVLDLNEKTLTGYIDQYDTNLNVKNGTIAGTVYVNGGATETDSYNHFTLDASATITSDYGIILYQAEGTKAGYGSTIDINGTVNGMVWVMGNIENGNSVVNVNSGAKIKGDVGVALNGMATVNVKEGATIEGSEVGIEARAGNLNVEGGNITSTATEYSVNPNGSGTTTIGAAIAVAQHTTMLATNVVISGGTLTGVKTISVADPQGNNLESVTVKAKDELVAANTVIPQDYKWLSDGAGMSTLVPCVYVAQIGDVKYESLADAVAAVPTEGTETTITMIADETVKGNSGVTIATTQNVKLDLNGKTVKLSVTESKGSQLITNRGTLTITDSSDGQTGKLTNEADESLAVGSWPTNNYVTNVITNCGTLNMEAGTVVNTANGSICYAIDNNSTSYDAILNVKGGTLTAVGTVIRQFCNSTTKQNVINMTGGLVTTEGYAAIWVQLPNSDATKAVKAELNVSGGIITGRNYAFYDYSYGNSFDATQYNLSGGTFNGDIFSYGANINITDGTYNGEVAIMQTKPSVVTVSGGKFAGDVYTYGDNASEGFITGGVYAINTYDYEGTTYDCDWTQLLADGYVATENLDPETMAEYPYTVAPMADQEYVLIDGEPSYKYARLGNVYASKVTYKRSFRNNQIGKYMPWYLPVDYTITGEEDAVFYKIDFIAAATGAGVIEDVSKVYIFTVKLNAGDVLKANRPYFIIPNSAGNYEFVSENVTLYKRLEEPDSRLHLEKSTINYDFYGNYETKIAEDAYEWLMMSGGRICWTDGPGADLGTYRWYIKPSSKLNEDYDYTKIRIDIAGDEDVVGISTQVVDDSEIEGYYSVNGTKLAVPVQGTNIVKYKNGVTKKIFIK